MIDFSKYDFLRHYISDERLEGLLDMYIRLYNHGPFINQPDSAFFILLYEKQRRNEIS
jgi:hypothetical protein